MYSSCEGGEENDERRLPAIWLQQRKAENEPSESRRFSSPFRPVEDGHSVSFKYPKPIENLPSQFRFDRVWMPRNAKLRYCSGRTWQRCAPSHLNVERTLNSVEKLFAQIIPANRIQAPVSGWIVRRADDPAPGGRGRVRYSIRQSPKGFGYSVRAG